MEHSYNYRARTSTNQVVTGLVQADNAEEAKKILIKNHLVPLSVGITKGILDYLPFYKKIGLKEKSFFVRQLATMIEAGLTLAQSLRLLVKQTKKGPFKTILESLLNDLQDGFSFSAALSKFPDVFDPIFINVVRSGEATGKLEVVLLQMADNMEKSVSVQGKIRGALAYPIFIIIAMIGVAILMLVAVIPNLESVFASANASLPGSTLFLIWLSNFFIHQWYDVILIVVVFIFGLRYFLRTPLGIRYFSIFSIKSPIIGSITVESNMANFGRLLAMLLSSGVPMLEALRLINNSFTNKIFKDAFAEVSLAVEQGIPMSVPISQNPVFPMMVGQMVSVGEQTGKMDEVIAKMAVYYQDQVDTLVAGMTSLVEPMIIIILGIGVGWLVMAILMPIYQISTAI